MKKKNILFALASSALTLSLFSLNTFENNFLEADNAIYEEVLVKDYDHPDYIESKAEVAAVNQVVIHYHNDDAKCDERAFWVWCNGVNGSAFLPEVSEDKKDMTLTLTFTDELEDFQGKKGLYFIVKYKTSWVGQSDNMYVDYSEFVPDDSGVVTVYCVPGEGNAIEMYATERETKMDRFQLATFEDWKTIEIIATDVPENWKLYALTSYYMSTSLEEAHKDRYLIASGSNPNCEDVEYNSLPCKKFEVHLNYTAKVNVQYYLEGSFPEWQGYTKTKYVSFHKLYDTERFNTYYNYDGDDLGVTYSKESTTFKVWAPTTARVRVMLYDSGTSEELAEQLGIEGSDTSRGYNMSFRPGGIWEATIKGDLNGKYYKYYVVNSLGKSEVCDPYAKAVGVNGDRAMIVDFSSTNPEGWDNVPLKWDNEENYDIKTPNELSVYETHIRDLTMDETWTGTKDRGTYSAFIEKGTTYTKSSVTVKTGFDHISEMGYKAVQLEPVFDSDNLEQLGDRTYNWGYNPLNYNCVDGSYATDPYDGASRIKEYKELVQAFANNGNYTRVIMDVVYNHVASAPGSCFNKLMPRYYFRYDEASGTYMDGSGCGNEVKSEAPMMRKYIVESLCWWAKEYKIKGFRFDLMGLIDVGTIDAARRALYEIDPDIILYGEGWTGDGSGYDYGNGNIYQVHGHEDAHDSASTTPEQAYAMNLGAVTKAVYKYLYPVENACYVGAFNDSGRNAMRGENNLNSGWGFIDQGSSDVGEKSKTVADMMIGYHTGMGGNPNQCVNYASCHDNYTLFDQLCYGIADSKTNIGLACAATSAVECAIMFSNGIAFFHGGEDVFRTKEVRTEEDIELAKAGGATHMINDKLISENSYNLSDDVNSFKWDRKISIGSVPTTGYIEEMAKAIKTRNSLKKYSYSDLEAHSPFDSGSEFNVWNQGAGSTTIAIKNGSYFCFISGCNNEVIPFGAYYDHSCELMFTSNKTGDYNGFEPAGEGAGKGIKLGWYTTLCFLVK